MCSKVVLEVLLEKVRKWRPLGILWTLVAQSKIVVELCSGSGNIAPSV